MAKSKKNNKKTQKEVIEDLKIQIQEQKEYKKNYLIIQALLT